MGRKQNWPLRLRSGQRRRRSAIVVVRRRWRDLGG